MSDLIKKTISVVDAKLDDKGNIKIKDQNGLTYTIWQTKSDNTMTIAYKQAQELGNLLGKSFNISHDEKPMTQGNGMYRAIKAIYASNPRPGANIAKPTFTPNNAPQAKFSPTMALEKGEPNWDKISWGKCKHAYLVEMFKFLLSKGETVSTDDNKVLAEKISEEWADMSMRKLNVKNAPEQSKKINEEDYQEDGEYLEDKMDIPF